MSLSDEYDKGSRLLREDRRATYVRRKVELIS
jgi:hypothetical protein